MTEFHNQEIPEARIIELSDRTDGTTEGRRVARFKPGELLPIGIDATKYAGRWLDSVDNITVTALVAEKGTLTVTSPDVQDGVALLLVDATAALDGGRWQVKCDAHPKPTYTVKVEFDVEVIGD